MIETIRAHNSVITTAAGSESLELLRRVGIPSPEERSRQYPHQLGGGLAQRVAIAMALTNRPKLLIADEPTTALDVPIQAQILDLLRELNYEFGLAVLHVTHNMGIVAESCDRTLVMYAGRIAEGGRTRDVFGQPLHPCTIALMGCVPDLSKDDQDLVPLVGTPPDLSIDLVRCEFEPRWARRFHRCRVENPASRQYGDEHLVRCHLY